LKLRPRRTAYFGAVRNSELSAAFADADWIDRTPSAALRRDDDGAVAKTTLDELDGG
jgi:hypothetical protein